MKAKVGFISLGCPKNQVDTEIMLGILKQNGYSIVNRAEEADIVVVNTCGFITPAKQEAVNTLLEMGQLKETGQLQYLVATGCLAQRYGHELLQELPELDVVVGVSGITRIAEVLDHIRSGTRVCRVDELPCHFTEKGPRVLTTPRGWAYLKIAEGCNNRCSYCAISSIRGCFRSRPVEELVKEAGWLVSQGVKELVLVAQDTTMYGQDLYGQPVLAVLLRALAEVEGLEWIRIMYAHPARLTADIIEVMARETKVIPYLDLPVQHAADQVLRRMGRGYRGEEVLALVDSLRREIPGLVIRTTVMVGFPDESEQNFAELCDFVSKAQFDWLGAFTYFKEEGTPAAAWKDTVTDEVKEARKAHILQIQQGITLHRNRSRLGQSERVLVTSKTGLNGYWGRGYYQAPEVDGITFIQTDEVLEPGQLVPVKLIQVKGYDLLGEKASN